MAVGVLVNASKSHPIRSHQLGCNGATSLKSKSIEGILPALNNVYSVVNEQIMVTATKRRIERNVSIR
jgi:hypothetical protein